MSTNNIELSDWKLRAAIRIIGGFVLGLLLIIGVTVAISAFIPGAAVYLRSSVNDTVIVLLASAYYLVYMSLVIWRLRRRSQLWSQLGLRPFPLTATLRYLFLYPFYYFGVLLLIGAAVVGIAHLFGGPVPTTPFPASQGSTSFSPAWILLIIFIAPIVEELLFRGILLPALVKRFGWKKGSVIDSLVFSLLHGPVAPLIMIFSLYLTRMYYRTNSIIPGIVLHMANNTAVVLILWASSRG